MPILSHPRLVLQLVRQWDSGRLDWYLDNRRMMSRDILSNSWYGTGSRCSMPGGRDDTGRDTGYYCTCQSIVYVLDCTPARIDVDDQEHYSQGLSDLEVDHLVHVRP